MQINMTPEEFLKALDRLGWKQTDFCRKAGVTKNTTGRWVSGETPIPMWADRFLAMALEIQRLAMLIDPKT